MVLLLVALAAAPFDAPRVVTVDDSLKFDSGRVARVEPKTSTLLIHNRLGYARFSLKNTVIVARDGKQHGGRRGRRLLTVGAPVSVWYHVKNGAIAREVDLGVPRARVDVVQLPPDDTKWVSGTVMRVDSSTHSVELQTEAGLLKLYSKQLQGVTVGQRLETTYRVSGSAGDLRARP